MREGERCGLLPETISRLARTIWAEWNRSPDDTRDGSEIVAEERHMLTHLCVVEDSGDWFGRYEPAQ